MRSFRFTYLIVLLFVQHLCLQTAAQYDKKTTNAVRCSVAPKLNGLLDDECWKSAAPATDFIINEPNPGIPLPHRTEVRIVYDDEAMYVGFMNFDTAPDSILKQLSGRDNSGNADYCGITFSCYRDGINGFTFNVSPVGEQYDARIDALNGEDASWNAVWNCKTAITPEGWSAEYRIPFAAIRFQNEEEHVWNINFVRHVRRSRQTAFWNGVNPIVPGFLTQMGELHGIRNITPPKRIFLFPYASTYRNYTGHEGGGAFKSSSYNAGMDIKLGLTDGFTLDATLVPDFGQVISDQLILNVTPFEVQFQDNRQFFMEGTELFNKAGLFYSRRVGDTPAGYYGVSGQLKDGEKIKENPSKAQLLNATKISGRNKNGLGIGFFNAVTNDTYATVEDSLGKTRRILTSPLSNYNIVVFDQNLKHNSYVSLINTNVTRRGSWYDANVTGCQFELRTKDNKYSVFGNGAYNVMYGREAQTFGKYSRGFKGDVAVGKIKGNLNTFLGVGMMSDTYDPNDFGFNTFNNYITYRSESTYNIYKPFGRFNSLWSSLNFYYSQLFNPHVYTGFTMDGNVGVNSKKWNTANFIFETQPVRGYDYFEARETGKKFQTNSYLRTGGWISTDYRKRFALDMSAFYTNWENPGRYQTSYRFAPRFRLNDHWFFTYVYSWQNHFNDRGWASRDSLGQPVFGRRDVISHTNVFNVSCSVNPWTIITCRVRHYWGFSRYKEFFKLNDDGTLSQSDFPGFVGENGEQLTSSKVDRNFNSFTIDLIAKWIFIPGSELSVVWKNSIIHENNRVPDSLRDDIDQTLALPANNSFSIKVLYFLDYRKLQKKLKTELGK